MGSCLLVNNNGYWLTSYIILRFSDEHTGFFGTIKRGAPSDSMMAEEREVKEQVKVEADNIDHCFVILILFYTLVIVIDLTIFIQFSCLHSN